ncbi:tRNA (guanosine(37)-N1)-methyltransferase TrmD [Variovorax sp. PCZ-1]|uniref:tRNA (guanosine(37)-N1)-methyltransferase TrmD n=1 Tax=Variovorax sp. PCZ-1 TaxID=2835533 RepID=UPI001BCEAB58|nr:tRNA (guanosine(37)-N1)-methyltransferase TrmD [Variovorax sp. PCZ-1]MBS7808006.1 tRNA (guanosine(37)-N1)-methyltransferase TrmD [Variovorax sp. PCZ-1]
MRFDIITLFPELFAPMMQSGIIRRAFEARADGSKAVDVHFSQLRDFADGNYRRIDDRPFGGGPGMLMMAEPLARCVESIQAERAALGIPTCPVILFSPIGQALKHAVVERFAKANDEHGSNPGAILICGRYEGLDQRFIDTFVTEQISIGDFVLSGGEIPAMALLDAVARLQPGVLSDDQSHIQDSFNPSIDGLLDHPHYTRPEVWRGQSVPPVLIGGNHAEINKWREAQRKVITQNQRPELLP